MTADAFCLPDVVFDEMTEKIVAIDGIDLVFLDLTNKPPGTIEWE
jgi:GMP synthase (glutamine-hydrolysing)